MTKSLQQEAFNHDSLTIGYIGSGFLLCRFLPVIYEQIKNPKKLNIKFLFMEMMASLLLGTAAIMRDSTPFILANGTSLVNVIIILIIQAQLYKNENLKKTPPISHPSHPSHPSDPSHPSHPSDPSHPSHPSDPSQTLNYMITAHISNSSQSPSSSQASNLDEIEL